MPNPHKRYYSVKEAAKILGVSTNTIYSYLEKGTLHAKRMGKGRFKILASELIPYFTGIEKGVDNISKKFSILGFLGTDKGYEVKGNFIFWRIYVAYLMLTVGVVHFFWMQNLLISIPLTLAGIATIYIAEKWEENKTLSSWIHFIDLVFLVLASVVGYLSGYYYLVIFLGSIAFTFLLELGTGVNQLSENGSLVREYIISTLVATVITGAFLIFIPGFLPFALISNFIEHNKITVAIGIVLASIPLLYTYAVLIFSNFEKRSHLEFFLFPFYGVISVVVATLYTNIGFWDMAFAGFLYGFLTFVVLWLRRVGTISAYRKDGLFITFSWIGIAITVGVLSIYLIQFKLKESTFKAISKKNDAVVNNINDFFTSSEGIVTSSVTSGNLVNILSSGNIVAAQNFSKDLYGSLSNINRVLVYDAQGIAIGVYPLSSITAGTNFSSREYFQTAKSTGRPYLSKLFSSVVGSKTIIYAVPVYSGRTFFGETGVAYNLQGLSEIFQSVSTGGTIFAYDATNKYVLNTKSDLIGAEVPKDIEANFSKGTFETDGFLYSCQTASVVEWKVCKDISQDEVLQTIYVTNIVIIIFLFVNAVQSLRAGFTLSEEGKHHI